MQIHRLFEITYLLMGRKTITAGELAERFEVSKRTILRDIDVLSAAGIPVYTTKGKGGGISIMGNYVFNSRILSDEEQDQILLALQGLSATGELSSDQLLNKLANLFEKANADWIEVDFSRWGQGASDNRRFELIKHAILYQHAVRFAYVGASGERSERTVYPLKLNFKSRAWYLRAFCTARQAYRTFKINRMLQIEETEEVFSRAAYALPPMEDEKMPPASLVSLDLVFPARVAWRLYDEFDPGSIVADGEGRLRVSARMPEDNWLYGFLLSFGKDVQVAAPEHVRDRLEKLRG